MIAKKRLLVSKVNLLGDTLVFLPALQAIIDFCRRSRQDLYILTTPIGKEVISAAFPGISKERFFVLDYAMGNKTSFKVYSFLNWAKKLGIGTAILSYDGPDSVYYASFLAGIRRIIGFDNKTRPGQRFLTDKVSFLKNKNIVEINFEQAKFYTGNRSIKPQRVPLTYSNKDARAVDARLSSLGAGNGFILIHPFAGRSHKEWSYANYKKLAYMVERHSKLPVIFAAEGTFAPADKNIPRFITGLSIRELAYLLKKARLFIGNNSGPMHLAAAMSTPVVTLQGPSPKQWDIYWDDVAHYKVFAGRTPCLSCFNIGCVPAVCRKKKNIARCVNNITVKKAFCEVAKAFGKT